MFFVPRLFPDSVTVIRGVKIDNYLNIKVFALTPRQAQISLIRFSTYKRSQSVSPRERARGEILHGGAPHSGSLADFALSIFPSTLRSRKFSLGYHHCHCWCCSIDIKLGCWIFMMTRTCTISVIIYNMFVNVFSCQLFYLWLWEFIDSYRCMTTIKLSDWHMNHDSCGWVSQGAVGCHLFGSGTGSIQTNLFQTHSDWTD